MAVLHFLPIIVLLFSDDMICPSHIISYVTMGPRGCKFEFRTGQVHSTPIVVD